MKAGNEQCLLSAIFLPVGPTGAKALIFAAKVFTMKNKRVTKNRTAWLLSVTALGLLSLYACKHDDKKIPLIKQQQAQDPEIVQLNELIDRYPKDDSLFYRRARAYYQLEGYDEALADIGKAIQLDSMQPAYYHLIADIYLDYARPNDSRRAIEALQTCLQKFPDRIPTLLKLSEFHLIVKQHTEALKTLNQVMLRDPQNPEAFFMSGRVALDKKDTTNAVASLRKCVQLDAGHKDAWMFLGRIYLEKDNPVALQCFDNVIRIDTADLEAREFKGVFHKRRGDFTNAFAEYRSIIGMKPDYANAYFDMGVIYLELDSLQNAYKNFDIAVKSDPLFVAAYYYRGVSQEQQGNLQGAIADYQQANKMSPDFEDAREALTRLGQKPAN